MGIDEIKKEHEKQMDAYFGDIIKHVEKYDLVKNSLQPFSINSFFTVQEKDKRRYDSYDDSVVQSDNSHGGFIAITEKQCLIGMNNENGRGTHYSAFAKVYETLHNLPPIQLRYPVEEKINGKEVTVMKFDRGKSMLEGFKHYYSALKEYICARFVYEKTVDEFFPKYKGYISFDLSNTVLTEKNIGMFNKFYEEYGEALSEKCRQLNIPVSYTLPDGKKKDNCKDLSDLKEDLGEYLKENRDKMTKESLNPDEEILTIPKTVSISISHGWGND